MPEKAKPNLPVVLPPIPKKSDRLGDLLAEMKANPKADWDIADVRKLCALAGVELTKPTRGSHYKVTSSLLSGHLIVPYRRPIKPFYIRELVGLIEAHVEAGKSR